MTDETPESLIPYDEIVQEALRAVVGRVLDEVETIGAAARRPSFLHHLQDPRCRASTSPNTSPSDSPTR